MSASKLVSHGRLQMSVRNLSPTCGLVLKQEDEESGCFADKAFLLLMAHYMLVKSSLDFEGKFRSKGEKNLNSWKGGIFVYRLAQSRSK